MSYINTEFYYFPANIETKKPLGKVKLFDYLKAIKQPQPHIVELFKQIEQASLDKNKKYE